MAHSGVLLRSPCASRRKRAAFPADQRRIQLGAGRAAVFPEGSEGQLEAVAAPGVRNIAFGLVKHVVGHRDGQPEILPVVGAFEGRGEIGCAAVLRSGEFPVIAERGRNGFFALGHCFGAGARQLQPDFARPAAAREGMFPDRRDSDPVEVAREENRHFADGDGDPGSDSRSAPGSANPDTPTGGDDRRGADEPRR